MRASEIEYPGAEPFDLWDVVPARLQAVLPNVMWSRDRLHQLELPVVELLVDELAWQLDLPWWRDSHEYFSVPPRRMERAGRPLLAMAAHARC